VLRLVLLWFIRFEILFWELVWRGGNRGEFEVYCQNNRCIQYSMTHICHLTRFCLSSCKVRQTFVSCASFTEVTDAQNLSIYVKHSRSFTLSCSFFDSEDLQILAGICKGSFLRREALPGHIF
jgi:hypothetical protein